MNKTYNVYFNIKQKSYNKIMNVNFIAEVSSNHFRDLSRCKKFIDEASRVGCSSVKFQLFKIEKLFAKEILEKSKKHRDRKKWELPVEFLEPLSKHTHKRGLKFTCTPFDLEAVQILEPFVDFYKIASYELLWDDLLKACALTGKEVILSTGMANIQEIKHAVLVLKEGGCKNIILLHCISGYPTPIDQCNLKAIETISESTGCKVGWSDHSVSSSVIYRAIHRWQCRTIEFHLDLDGKGPEFETGHCWLPSQIEDVINNVNLSFYSDGNGEKVPSKVELPDRDWRADPEDGLRPLKSIRKEFK